MSAIAFFIVCLCLIINFAIQEEDGRSLISGVLVVIGIGALLLALVTTENEKYMQGQVDCMNGDIKYELRVKQDSSYKYIGD